MNNTNLLKPYLFLLFLIFPLLLFAQNNKKQTKKKECDLTITFDYDVEDLNVIFTNTVQNYDNILWDFGDGNTSKDDSPIHLYSKTGGITLRQNPPPLRAPQSPYADCRTPVACG
mgnify:CR=1 FL=1